MNIGYGAPVRARWWSHYGVRFEFVLKRVSRVLEKLERVQILISHAKGESKANVLPVSSCPGGVASMDERSLRQKYHCRGLHWHKMHIEAVSNSVLAGS